MIHKVIGLLAKITPAPIRTTLKTFGFDRLQSFGYNKYAVELSFQVGWAKEFKQSKFKVLEYWKKYRYLDEINTICKITEDSKVLDVGCGISTVLHYVKGKKFGIDPLADEYLRLYKYPEGINIKKGFGEHIPFRDEYFDVVFCSNVLDHVTDQKKTVDEIHRILKESGYFVLTVELFREKTKRNHAHTSSLTKRNVYSFLGDRFNTIFEKESPWIGIRNYVNGSRESHNEELIMILARVRTSAYEKGKKK